MQKCKVPCSSMTKCFCLSDGNLDDAARDARRRRVRWSVCLAGSLGADGHCLSQPHFGCRSQQYNNGEDPFLSLFPFSLAFPSIQPCIRMRLSTFPLDLRWQPTSPRSASQMHVRRVVLCQSSCTFSALGAHTTSKIENRNSPRISSSSILPRPRPSSAIVLTRARVNSHPQCHPGSRASHRQP